jgi:hypothetical protein
MKEPEALKDNENYLTLITFISQKTQFTATYSYYLLL